MRLSSSWITLLPALVLVSPIVEARKVQSQFNPVGSGMFDGMVLPRRSESNSTTLRDMYAPTEEEREEERQARRERQRERNARVKESIKYMQPDQAEKVSQEELEKLSEDHPSLRQLWGGNNGKSNSAQYADPGDDYDMWQQAYRMLGGFIDCDHQKDEGGSHDEGNGDGDGGACSRWMMWASVSYTLLVCRLFCIVH